MLFTASPANTQDGAGGVGSWLSEAMPRAMTTNTSPIDRGFTTGVHEPSHLAPLGPDVDCLGITGFRLATLRVTTPFKLRRPRAGRAFRAARPLLPHPTSHRGGHPTPPREIGLTPTLGCDRI